MLQVYCWLQAVNVNHSLLKPLKRIPLKINTAQVVHILQRCRSGIQHSWFEWSKKSKRLFLGEGQNGHLHPFRAGEPYSALVLGYLMRLDKLVGACRARISCLGSGIIPISLQNDAANPTNQVDHECRCPQYSKWNKLSRDTPPKSLEPRKVAVKYF